MANCVITEFLDELGTQVKVGAYDSLHSASASPSEVVAARIIEGGGVGRRDASGPHRRVGQEGASRRVRAWRCAGCGLDATATARCSARFPLSTTSGVLGPYLCDLCDFLRL